MPRVLVDAAAVPADRGALIRYVDGLVAGLDRAGADLAVVCQRADAERYARSRALGPDHAWPCRDHQPGRPARLGADRPAAARPPGGGAGHPRPLLLDADRRGPADSGDRARRHLVHRARAAQRGPGVVLQVRHPHRRTPRHPRHRAVQGDQGRADPRARRRSRPASTSPTTAWTSESSTRRATSRCAARSPTGSACTASRTSPSSARWSRARTCPNLIRGCAMAVEQPGQPPALVLGGGVGWDDDVDAAVGEVPRHRARWCVRATCAFTDLPGFLGGALVVAFPSRGEGFGLPVLEAMACGAPVLTTHRTSLPEVGGDAVAYTEPDADSIATRCGRCSTPPSARRAAGARPGRPEPASSPGRRPRRRISLLPARDRTVDNLTE